jgi:3-(methylthio)propanoyl-CoA dehydrogenase
MMNAARLSVGLEGYAMAERAFQQAADWGKTRVQGKPPMPASGAPLPIMHHPDVKRMLLGMKAHTEAMRAVALYAAHQLDLAKSHPDTAARAAAQARGDLLIPIVKGWSTESGIEIASQGIQVHGGMGFIEETGAAQLLRDVRITAIYEGTTGIQANDLLGRKLGRDQGAAMGALISDIERDLNALDAHDPTLRACKTAAEPCVAALRDATRNLVAAWGSDPKQGLAVAVPYLHLCGTVIGAWLMLKAAAIAAAQLAGKTDDRNFYIGKIASARFYAEHIAPRALSFARIVTSGADSVVEFDANLLG